MDLVASGWVFFIDADEWLDVPPRLSLKEHLCEVTSEFGGSVTFAPAIREHRTGMLYLDVPRILPVANMRFTGAVHEYPRLIDQPGICPGLVGLEIPLWHDGYTPGILQEKQKIDRNLRLLRADLRGNPRDPRTLFYLLRDGIATYDLPEITGLLAMLGRPLSQAPGDPHSTEDYVERGRVCACERLIALAAWDKVLAVCQDLDSGGRGPHPDSLYYRSVVQLQSSSVDPGSLIELVKLRRDDDRVARSHVDVKGRHLDAAIGACLFRLRGAIAANEYLATCEPWSDAFFDESRWAGVARPSEEIPAVRPSALPSWLSEAPNAV